MDRRLQAADECIGTKSQVEVCGPGGSCSTLRSRPIVFGAMFAWAMSSVSAIICASVRAPLGGPHWFVFGKAFLLAAAVISCASLLSASLVERRRTGYAPVLISTLAMIFLPCLSWLVGSLADVVIYPVYLGFAACGARMLVAAHKIPGSRLGLALVCGGVAGLGYFFIINSKGYASVLTPELALVGTQHLDTLFHASIAGMLVKHGALSTGLDGLVAIKYHVLSHIWLGCLGIWFGVTTLDAYFIGAQVVAIPLLLFSLMLATSLLQSSRAGSVDAVLATLVPLLLLFITDLFGFTSYLVSESYFVAMILFLLSLPLLVEIADEGFYLRLSMQLAALAIAGTLILISKVSVGTIFWAAAGFLLWRQRGLTFLSLAGLAVPILLFVRFLAALSSPDAGTYLNALRPFSFLRDFPQAAWPNVVANLVLLAMAWRVWLSGSMHDKRSAEAFAIIAIGSLMPALLFDIAGGSAYYFANVGAWACIVVVSAYGLPALAARSLGLWKPAVLLAAIVLVALATSEKRNSVWKLATQFGDLQTRARTLNGEQPATPSIRRDLVELLVPDHPARRELAEEVGRTPGGLAKRTLLSVRVTQDPGTAVFAPPDNRAFWTAYEDCRGDPFFVPALLGVPMLKGLNPSALRCGRDPYYTSPSYPPDVISEPMSDAQLCMRAADWKESTVIVLEAPTVARKIACAPKQR